LCGSGQHFFQPFLKNRTGEQHAPVTSQAAQANVSPDAINDPFIAAAGVFLTHLHPITNYNVLHTLYDLINIPPFSPSVITPLEQFGSGEFLKLGNVGAGLRPALTGISPIRMVHHLLK
jgi:hypothetical protein